MGLMKNHLAKIFGCLAVLVLILGVSETADRWALSATSAVACSLAGGTDFCVRITNKLASYTPEGAAQTHFENCKANKSKDSCVNAAILFSKLSASSQAILSFNEACGLGDKVSCQQAFRAAQRYIEESELKKVSAKEMKARLGLALSVYSKGCQIGEGESCALAARSPLTPAKSVYSYFYRGCYTLNHPTSCIGMAEHFKAHGQAQLAQNAVARICQGKKSLACIDLMERMGSRKAAQARVPSSSKYN
jgi:hypothetical protein